MRKFFSLVCALICTISVFNVAAQSMGDSKTLFKYPVAPDTCTTLESRCNYIVVNFWNNYDITRPIKDDVGFEQAFRDYVNFFKYAHRNIVLSSVRDFIFRARVNTPNLIKVGKVAESALYGPAAEYWSDELYVEVAKFLSESTGLKQAERNRYKNQIKVINNTIAKSGDHEGSVLPDFDVITADGKKKFSTLEGKTFFLFFTDGSSTSSMECVRLNTDLTVSKLVELGEAVVVQIYLGKPGQDWFKNQPKEWINCSSEQAANVLDIRFVPSCYILDDMHRVLTKNVSVGDIKSAFN